MKLIYDLSALRRSAALLFEGSWEMATVTVACMMSISETAFAMVWSLLPIPGC